MWGHGQCWPHVHASRAACHMLQALQRINKEGRCWMYCPAQLLGQLVAIVVAINIAASQQMLQSSLPLKVHFPAAACMHQLAGACRGSCTGVHMFVVVVLCDSFLS